MNEVLGAGVVTGVVTGIVAGDAPVRRWALPSDWSGRVDALEGVLGMRWHQMVDVLSMWPPARVNLGLPALLGFACDAGVVRNQGRAGAAQAPAVLRRALGGLPVSAGVQVVDAGDVVCVGDGLEAAQAAFAAEVTRLLDVGYVPVGLGGGHELAYASFMGWAAHLAAGLDAGGPVPRIGILNFDAHFDLRFDTRPSSGTPFFQIEQVCRERGWGFDYWCWGVSACSNTQALFERARALGVSWCMDEQMQWEDVGVLEAKLDAWLASLDGVYVTVDLDVLPAYVAPGVSAPAAFGVPLAVVERLLLRVCASPKLALLDVAEFNPVFDVDGHTARVAARLLARAVTVVCGRCGGAYVVGD